MEIVFCNTLYQALHGDIQCCIIQIREFNSTGARCTAMMCCIVLYYYLVTSCIILYFIVDKRGYQSIGVAAWQDADEDGIPDLQDGDLNNGGIMDRTVKNDAYLNCK